MSRSELKTKKAAKYYRETNGREEPIENTRKIRWKRWERRKRIRSLFAGTIEAAMAATDPARVFKRGPQGLASSVQANR